MGMDTTGFIGSQCKYSPYTEVEVEESQVLGKPGKVRTKARDSAAW